MTTVSTSSQEAIELLTRTLDEEYGASPDPEPDDELHSELDVPQIERLRPGDRLSAHAGAGRHHLAQSQERYPGRS
jgi:hypothetical protein